MNRSHRIALLITGVALTAGVQSAAADVRVHIGGSAHVRIGGGSVRARPVPARWVRPWRQHHVRRPVIRIGGSIWLGRYYQPGPFAQPPPPPPPQVDCNCEPTYYPPIAPAPQSYPVTAYYAAAPVEPPPLSRFGLGAFLGGVDVDGEHEGKDVGLTAQIRLTRGLLAEAELAENELADGERTDRRFMVGLQYELSPRRRLSPYVAGAIGVSQVEIGDDEWEDNQSLAEIGAGLRFRLSERFSLFGDLRFGQRETIEKDEGTPPPVLDGTSARVLPEDQERYSRGRVGLMLTF